jgi:phosphoribosylformylglycinamidine cyclo-ligase
MGKNIRIVKDKLFDIPPLFDLIRKESGLSLREMYQVFNMGHRLECYVSDMSVAEDMIQISASFGIEAKIIGRVEASEKPQIVIEYQDEKMVFDY